jgi:peptidoglycan/xylan/chitin deacetylase (PgdA/CDA1 family)
MQVSARLRLSLRWLRWFLGPGLLVALLAGCGGNPDWDSEIDQIGLAHHSIRGEALAHKTLILTFDDGPDEHTREIAEYLHANDIHATFFINGRRICKTVDNDGHCLAPMDTKPCEDGHSQAPVADPRYYPESLLDDLIALGHRVANHSEDHCRLTTERHDGNLLFELQETQTILNRHIRDDIFLFRAPYGAWDGATDARVRTDHMLDVLTGPIGWDIDGRDYACWHYGFTVEECGQRYLAELGKRSKRNGIVLMHDRPEFNVGYEGPLLLVKWLVPRLKQSGYQFATIPDLIDAIRRARPHAL